jgi:GST-like protein
VTEPITVYGAEGSGSVAVELTLTLLGIPYKVVEAVTWVEKAAQERVAPVNPVRQVPAIVFPSGEIMTESAAILIYLADLHPEAHLAPLPTDPKRAEYLRWMSYVSSAIYSWFWAKGDPMRLALRPGDGPAMVDRIHDRIAACWRMMDEQITPGRYVLGNEMSVLDIYVTVISRFGPWRNRFYKTAPKLSEIVRRMDADPRLKPFWDRRFPFEDDWEG